MGLIFPVLWGCVCIAGPGYAQSTRVLLDGVPLAETLGDGGTLAFSLGNPSLAGNAQYELRISAAASQGFSFDLEFAGFQDSRQLRRLLDAHKLMFYTDADGTATKEGQPLQVLVTATWTAVAVSAPRSPPVARFIIVLERLAPMMMPASLLPQLLMLCLVVATACVCSSLLPRIMIPKSSQSSAKIL